MRNKKRIIEIEVNDEYVVGSGVVIGAAGSHNDVIMKVRFNSSWVGLNIIATFRDALGENPISVVLTAVSTLVADESDGDHCVHKFLVPLKAKAYEGKISLSFTGYTVAAVASEDGEGVEYQETQAITSGTAYFNVLKSDAVLADDIFKTADVGQQLHTDVDTLGKMYGDLDEALGKLEELFNKVAGTQVVMWKGDVNAVLNSVYPVGSIFISLSDKSPNDFGFAGVWDRIGGRFLVGADEKTFILGDEGGYSTHSHSASNMRALFGGDSNSTLKFHFKATAAGSSWTPNKMINVSSSATSDISLRYTGIEVDGNTDDVSNLPPYLAVNIWKRLPDNTEVQGGESNE